ncbi:MAG: asparagine synthase (glutamine-hydrolyzing) [Candidatus Omnitrophota bacterium]
MCGISGNLNLTKDHNIDTDVLKKMILLMHHRGPDECGIYKDSKVGLAHARLSIIDIAGGQQPIHNEDRSIWIVYNGEIFNYPELREQLIKKGHCFYTNTDTEVIVHLYEEKGPACLQELNGQFALAIWDTKKRQLFMARDRVGIRPLFYTIIDGSLIFASEIKAIFADNRVPRELDPRGLDEIFTFWTTIPPQTVFKNIQELPPAHYMIAKEGNIYVERYWDWGFPEGSTQNKKYSEQQYAEELLELLKDSTRIRLRADVPVASYLSGGLDSSLITSIVKKHFNNDLKTFSVSFADKDYDESGYQQQMLQQLHTDHRQVTCQYSDIGKIIPDILWHTEKPIMRTAPAPLMLLSKLVRENNIKVVLTGEGADEVLAGYDLFREMKIRRFWAQNPESKLRPLLLKKLYHYLPNWPKKASLFLEAFYNVHLPETDKFCYSHIPRWMATSQIKQFFSSQLKADISGLDCIAGLSKTIPDEFKKWNSLSQAQYLEVQTLLSGYLLSSQGDRMMMANSVEGRFPFLDHRVMEFCAKIPPALRLKVMNEKYILKKIAASYVPEPIINRKKQGYRAPDSLSFFSPNNKSADAVAYLEEILSERNISETGYFDPQAVAKLVNKCKNAKGSLISAHHNRAIVGIISTLLLDNHFIRNFDNRLKECQALRKDSENINIMMFEGSL